MKARDTKTAKIHPLKGIDKHLHIASSYSTAEACTDLPYTFDIKCMGLQIVNAGDLIVTMNSGQLMTYKDVTPGFYALHVRTVEAGSTAGIVGLGFLKRPYKRSYEEYPGASFAVNFSSGSAVPIVGTGSYTFNRDTVATISDNTGLIQNLAVDEIPFSGLRYTAGEFFDHEVNGPSFHPSVRGGVEIWEQRTNEQAFANDLTNEGWTLTNAGGLTTSAGTAPDGTNTAYNLYDVNLGEESQSVAISYFASYTAWESYVFSAYAKEDKRHWFWLNAKNFGVTWRTVEFDLQNVVSETNHPVDSHGIQYVGNGWYRCWMQFWMDADASGDFILGCGGANGGDNLDSDGSHSIYIWGPQVEPGFIPSSWKDSNIAFTTHDLDELSYSAADCADDMTILVSFKTSPVFMSDFPYSYVFSINGVNDSIYITIDDEESVYLRAHINGSTIWSESNSVNADSIVRVGLVLSNTAANRLAYIDGSAFFSTWTNNDSAGLSLDNIVIGNSKAGTSAYNGTIHEFQIVPRLFSAAELAEWTTG